MVYFRMQAAFVLGQISEDCVHFIVLNLFSFSMVVSLYWLNIIYVLNMFKIGYLVFLVIHEIFFSEGDFNLYFNIVRF